MRRSGVPGAYVLLLAVAYYLAARLGLGFRFHNSQIGVVWPATGLWIAALLLTPRSRWWIVMLTAAAAHAAAVGSSIPVWRLLWQIGGNTIFAGATALALQRVAGTLHFSSARQVSTFIAIAFLMPAFFSLTTPAFVRAVLNLESGGGTRAAALRTTLSNGTGILLVVPVVILWARAGFREVTKLPARRLFEAAGVMSALLLLGTFAFGAGPEIARVPSLLLWIFPPLLWAAVRFGPIGASTSLFCVAALSVWGTARQLGPFVLTANADQILGLQVFWIVLCPPVLLLAAAIRERERVETLLQEQRSQLAHVTRLTTIGELAGTFAHELSQPLASIRANASAGVNLLGRPQIDRQELCDILNDIVQQDKQASHVIDRLRLFLKGGAPRFESVSVDAIVRDALALGRGAIETSGVDVDLHVAAPLPRVRGDRVQLLQVMLNLLVNGCDAMNGMPASRRQLRIRIAQADAHHVEVLVSDCGGGLPDGPADRVFEPFFTTKHDGLGLGLAISRSIATAHGGRLWAENAAQGGAAFHLLLPADQ